MIVAMAVAPAWGQAPPQTAPASLPAETVRPLDPREVVEKFMIGVLSGDEKAVYDNMTFTNEDSRREAQAIIGEALVQQQLDELMTNLEEEKRLEANLPADDRAENRRRQLLENLRTSIAKSEVAPAEPKDTAEVKVDGGPVVYLLRVGGAWKIDFEKTQRTHEGAVDKVRIAELTQRIKVYKDLIAEIQQAKFQTAQQVNLELLKRMSLLPPAKLAPEDRPPADPKRTAALADMRKLKTELGIFEIDNVRYPSDEEGLGALIKMPRGLERSWRKAKDLDAIPKDPWNNDYVYRLLGPQQFELISAGPDGKLGTADDLNQNSK
jgi:type II secretion system protein G